jgi:hypothetical protein
MQEQQFTSSLGKTVQYQERHYYSLGGRVRELNDADVSERVVGVYRGHDSTCKKAKPRTSRDWFRGNGTDIVVSGTGLPKGLLVD